MSEAAADQIVACCNRLWAVGGGRRVRGFQNPTSELDLHLRIYRGSPVCGGADHGAAGQPWGRVLGAGSGTARARMETLEHAAKIIHSARSLGRVNRLTREQRDELDTRRRTPRNG